MIIQKKTEEKFCNCRNSKCMKLYCQCFAARIECGKNCHCVDCHNKNNSELHKHYKDYNNSERKILNNDLAKQHKGCACRKSGCTKKYCQCYQAGLLCRDICKCVDCQNNESLSNKKVISELKRNTSSNSNKTASLYPIILTQDNRHMNQILADQNPLNINDEWIEKTAQDLYIKAKQGSVPMVIEKLLDILQKLQKDINEPKKQQKMILKEQQSEMQQQENMNESSMRQQEDEQDSQMLEELDAEQPISYQNFKSEE